VLTLTVPFGSLLCWPVARDRCLCGQVQAPTQGSAATGSPDRSAAYSIRFHHRLDKITQFFIDRKACFLHPRLRKRICYPNGTAALKMGATVNATNFGGTTHPLGLLSAWRRFHDMVPRTILLRLWLESGLSELAESVVSDSMLTPMPSERITFAKTLYKLLHS
jgi:hypothetical protein